MSPRGLKSLPVMTVGLGCLLAVLAAPEAPGAEKTPFETALKREVLRRGIPTSKLFEEEIRNGLLEMRSRNYIRAAHHFGGAYRESKEHPLPPLLTGVACIGMEQDDKASEFLRHALKLWPELPRSGLDLKAWLLDGNEVTKLGQALSKRRASRRPGTPEASRALFLEGFFHACTGFPSKGAKVLRAVPETAASKAVRVMPSILPSYVPSSRKTVSPGRAGVSAESARKMSRGFALLPSPSGVPRGEA